MLCVRLLVLVCACAEATATGPDEAAPMPEPQPAAVAIPGTRVAFSEIRLEVADAAARAQVRARAEAVRARLRAGEDFAGVARAESTAASAPRGGRIGTFVVPTFDARIEAALAALAIGDVSAPVDVDGAVYLLRREPVREVVVRWAEVGWTGALGASVARTEAEALALATAAAEALRSGATPPGVDALGVDRIGPDVWSTALTEAAFSLTPGAARVVRTPQGFVVLALEGPVLP